MRRRALDEYAIDEREANAQRALDSARNPQPVDDESPGVMNATVFKVATTLCAVDECLERTLCHLERIKNVGR